MLMAVGTPLTPRDGGWNDVDVEEILEGVLLLLLLLLILDASGTHASMPASAFAPGRPALVIPLFAGRVFNALDEFEAVIPVMAAADVDGIALPVIDERVELRLLKLLGF